MGITIRRSRGRFALPALLVGLSSGLVAQGESSRAEWQRAAEVVAATGAAPGARVADVGSGDGFYTVRLARAVGPTGRVYAVDVNPTALERLRARLEREGVSNVEVIRGRTDDPGLPAGTLDGALIVNAYHEMEEHAAMLGHIRRALKPDGRLVLLEPISDEMRIESRARQTRSHEIAPELAEDDVRRGGFRVARLEDPFATPPDGRDRYWLMVARPEAAVSAAPAAVEPEAEAEASADLRVSLDEFRRLFAAGQVVVIDVRGEEAYRAGHIPGASVAAPSDVAARAPALKTAGASVVTYCD